MAAETGQYDPWNAAVRSAAAAGGGWRADVRPAQSLSPGEGEKEAPQGQFARLVGERVTKTTTADAPKDADADPKGGEEGGEDESWLTVDDFIDVINPLQQLPVISTIYREFTGDAISPAARIAGGALYFWPFGAVGAAADVALEAVTGDDLGGHVMAFLDVGGGEGAQTAEADDAEPPTPVQAAEAAPGAASAAASGAAGAPQMAALPADMLEALQKGGAVRPLNAEGFAFPPSSGAASAAARAAYGSGAPSQPRAEAEAEAEAEAQAQRAADARALRQSRAGPADGPPPPGSVAAEGGWFSSVMLQGLSRYESAQDLARRQSGPSVNIEN